MWIKTEQGTLLNLDNGDEIETVEYFGSFEVRFLPHFTFAEEANLEHREYKGTFFGVFDFTSAYRSDVLDKTIAAFETETEAQNYLNKLAEKLGAEVID